MDMEELISTINSFEQKLKGTNVLKQFCDNSAPIRSKNLIGCLKRYVFNT